MPAPVNRDLDRLDLILEVIGRLRRRLDGMTREQLFADDRDELDLASYRLSVIGENTNKLSVALKARNPHIDWDNIYYLRNRVAHGYEHVDPAAIWKVVGEKLTDLQAVCEAELATGDAASSTA